MQTIFLFHNAKWYYPIWALLFALSLIILWFRRKKWEKGYNVFFWLVVLSLIIVYCPLLACILVPRFMPSYGEYERLAWVFFEIPLISYVIIKLSQDIKDKRGHHLFIILFLVILVFFGSLDNRSFYNKPHNQYKISQDAITICNIISRDSLQDNPVVCIQFRYWSFFSNGTGPEGTLYYGIRTYNSNYRLHTQFVYPWRYEEKNTVVFNSPPKDTDYYICPKISNIENIYRELNNLGYSYVDESDNFSVFYNEKN